MAKNRINNNKTRIRCLSNKYKVQARRPNKINNNNSNLRPRLEVFRR